jgi:hypothetical protein
MGIRSNDEVGSQAHARMEILLSVYPGCLAVEPARSAAVLLPSRYNEEERVPAKSNRRNAKIAHMNSMD